MEEIQYDNENHCPKCGSLNEVTIIESFRKGVTEAETVCSHCGHRDHWAYGWYLLKDG